MSDGRQREHARRPRLVSVVVPVRNAAGTLGDQLAALDRQDHPGPLEVVVADHGSTDGSRELAERWAAGRADRRVVAAQPGGGAGRARNAGAAAARGELLLFSDADDVADRGWVDAMVRVAAAADVVVGRFDVEALNPALTRSWNDPPPPGAESFKGYLKLVTGSNAGIWRDVFERLGGFDPDASCGEDVCLGWRAQLEELSVRGAPDAVIRMRYRTGLAPAFRQFFKYGQGDAWLYSRYRRTGMPASPRSEVAARWRSLLVDAPGAARCQHRRGRWVQSLGLACGRAVGSARHRVVYL